MTKFVKNLIPHSKRFKQNLYLNKYMGQEPDLGLGLLCNNRCLFWNSKLPIMIDQTNHPMSGKFAVKKIPNIVAFIHTSSLNGREQEEELLDSGVVVFPTPRAFVEEDHSEQFRNSLFSNSTDPVILQLKSSVSTNEVFDILNNNLQSLTVEQYCQSLLVIWDLVHVSNSFSKTTNENKTFFPCYSLNTTNVGVELRNIFGKMTSVSHLHSSIKNLPTDCLVCCILYSIRLGIRYNNSFIQKLFERVNHLLECGDEKEFPISAVSRLTLTLYDIDEIWAKLMMVKTLPIIYKHFDKCDDAEDFRALTISMLSAQPYLREELLVQYECLTEEFLRTGKITNNDTSTIIKSVLLLSSIYHKPTARLMVYKLLQLLNFNQFQLFIPHLNYLFKIARNNLEPHHLIVELEAIRKGNQELFTATEDVNPASLHMFTVPQNPRGSHVLKELIRKSGDLQTLLCVQSQLTTAYMEACHQFWHKVAQLLSSSADSNDLIKVCNRYITFTEQMGSYRNRQFEHTVLSLIATEMVEGSAVMQPYKLCQLAAFVLAYDNQQLSADLVCRLLPVVPQLNTDSCLALSKGLKQGLHYQPTRLLYTYLQLDSALNERTKQIWKTENDNSIYTFNILLRSCINRKGSVENDLLWDILKWFSQLDWSQLTSRSLRNLVYNLQVTKLLVPSAVDQMIEYCLHNQSQVMGDTTGKLLHLCFCLGYTPTLSTVFCHLTGDLVYRDREMMNGLSLLQVALSLSYFHLLPSSLNHFIFSVSFLERLDNEIKNCFAKDKYPMRLRQTLMQLNRSVCLDQPEADVPWFHTKFCEEQKSLGRLDSRPKTLLFTDVRSTLASLVGNPKYLQTNSTTPYGYSIDIQLNLDSALNPTMPHDLHKAAQKVAVLMHYNKCFTVCERRLKGYYQMKQRHLEILGYRVVSITDSVWNAMFMSEPRAKQDYLKSLIFTTPSSQSHNGDRSVNS